MRPGWDPAEFGQAWAVVYDEAHDLDADTVPAVRMLTERLRHGARVLDLGTGTGRLAIPLAANGLDVVGVDASERMLQQLRAKPGGSAVTTVLADMTAPPVAGPFDCVLIAFNTLFALSSQDAQVACLQASASLLADDGSLVVDLAVPQPWRLADHDPLTQTVRTTRALLTEAGVSHTLPLNMRYAYPPEVDLMARLAGLQLHHRSAGWDGAPFDRDSTRHVSLYRPLPTDPPQDIE